jgi:hypothetical protein
MPFQISDPDGDSARLFSTFDDATEWSEIPANGNPNVIPVSVFAQRNPPNSL